MQALAEASGSLFGWLLRNSAHAALLVVVVWLAEKTFCRRLGPRWRYGLWLLVMVRSILPIAPESALSLFNLVDFAPAGLAGAALEVLGLPSPVVVPLTEPLHPLADTPGWFVWALAFWVPGAVVLAGLVWLDHLRLRQALAATTPVLDSEVLGLLRQSRAVMRVWQQVAVVETSEISSPAISGCLRPRLLLPVGLLERLRLDEIRFLFLHELAHVKRADLALNWVLALIQVLHWFNPLVWIAVRRLLAVREEVCDDLVLRKSFPGASREYGLTLLRLLEECAPRRIVPALAGVLDDLRSLRRRMRCIRNFVGDEPRPWVPAGITLSLAIAGLTDRSADLHMPAAPAITQSEVSTAAAKTSKRLALTVPGANRSRGELTGESLGKPRRPVSTRVVGTLSSALNQVAEEARPRRAGVSGDRLMSNGSAAPASTGGTSRGAPPWPGGPSTGVGGRASGTPGLRSAPAAPSPTAALPSPVFTTYVNKSGARPYPLPPVGQRGDILRLPRPAAGSTEYELPPVHTLEVGPYLGRTTTTEVTRRAPGYGAE